MIKFNIVLIIIISFFPIGKLGLKFLEKDYINNLPIENLENIIVLAGSENLNATDLTNKLNLNASSERLIESAVLLNRFKNSRIFYVGGNGYIIKNKLSEVLVAKKFYTQLNIDLDRIIFIGNTRNTIENLKEIQKLNINNENSILITSAFHMKRSLMIAKKFNLNLVPHAVDFRSISNKSLINSYQSFSISANLTNFDLFLREIIGIIAFKILI